MLPDFSSYHRILSIRLFLSCYSKSLVEVRIQSKLTHNESDFDALGQQPDGLVVVCSDLSSPEIGIIEVEFDLHFRLQYHDFSVLNTSRCGLNINHFSLMT